MAWASAIDPTFAPNITGLGGIVAAAQAGDGSLFVGGDFDAIAGVDLNGLARIKSDGSVDANFAPQLLPAGSTLNSNGMTTLQDGRVLLTGNFKAFGATPSHSAVILNPDGSVSQTFPYTRTDIYIIQYFPLASGKFMVVDEPSPQNSAPTVGFARLHSDGSVDSDFTCSEQGVYRVLDLQDGSIVIAHSPNTVRKLGATGARESAFTPSTYNGIITSMIVQPDGKILVAGAFSGGIVRLNADGSPDTSFAAARGSGTTGPNSTSDRIQSVLLDPDGHIWIGGDFSTFSGAVAIGLVRLAADGTPDATSYNVGGSVARLMPTNGRTLVAGNFRSLLGTRRWSAAQLRSDLSLDPDFLPLVTNRRAADVTAFGRQPDDKLIVAGRIEAVDGIPTSNLVRLMPDGSLDPTFHAPTELTGFPVVSGLAVRSDGAVLLMGGFTTLDGFDRPTLARLTADGQVDLSFDASLGGQFPNGFSLNADGSLFVTTQGSTFHGVARVGLALLNSDGSLDGSLDPGSVFAPSTYGSPVVTRASFSPDRMRVFVIGHFFLALGPLPPYQSLPPFTSNLAALKADGSLDVTFSANLAAASLTDLLPQPDGGVFVVGNYSSSDYTGPYQLCISRLRADGKFDSRFGVADGFRGNVSKISSQADGRLILAGQFRPYVQGPTVSLWRLNYDGTADLTFPNYFGDFPNRGLLLTQDGSVLTQSKNHNSLVRISPDTGAPTVTASPTSIRRLPGASLQLNVAASGAPALQIQWFRNGAPIPNAHDSTLLLANLSSMNTGEYKAVVTNPQGKAESAAATVSFNTSPQFGTIDDLTFAPFPLSDIEFSIPFVDAESPPASLDLRFTWQASPSVTDFSAPNMVRNPDGSYYFSLQRFSSSPTDSWAWIEITLTGTDPDDGIAAKTFRIYNRDPHYTEWAALYFSPAELSNPAISGENADPNHNGVSNLLEYARGSNPISNDGSRNPVLVVEGPANNRTLTLTYYDTLRPDDIYQQLETSDNLQTWDTTGQQWVTMDIQPTPDGRTARVTLRLDATIDATTPRKFIRFRAISSQ